MVHIVLESASHLYVPGQSYALFISEQEGDRRACSCAVARQYLLGQLYGSIPAQNHMEFG